MPDIEHFLSQLRAETDTSVRNILALDLSRTGSIEVLPVLVELIERPDLRDQRGTLVHCMAQFDCSEYFGLLVELVISGNWEVANEAFNIFEEIGAISNESTLAGYNALLQAESVAEEVWRCVLIDQLLVMFE